MGIKEELVKIAAKEAVGKILPMEKEKPKLGKKAKLAGILGAIATAATLAAQYLGG